TGRDVILDQDQALHLIEVAPADFRDVLQLAIYTGMRRGEIVSLEWRDVDLRGREIRLRGQNTKTGQPRTVPMLSIVHGILKALNANRTNADGRGLVIARTGGRPWTPIMFRRRWAKTMGAAKDLPVEIRDELVFHGLRHCFASFLINAGQPLNVVAELLGHSLQTTTLRYAHLVPETKRAAVEAVEAGLQFADDDLAGRASADGPTGGPTNAGTVR
ncbi:MAG: site-specific integrase, partial [Planctomycetota bacterium]|nr:site-specific integrase [Planctomycetota bacterium]